MSPQRTTLKQDRLPRRLALAACLALALGPLPECIGAGSQTAPVALAPAHAGSTNGSGINGAVVVQNCSDSGPGSLRAAVQSTVDGDTIDLSQLQCSLITLTTGRIETSGNITIQGPGAAHLTIDGNHSDRVLNHAGTSLFTLNGMTLAHGANDLTGGCLYATGTLVMHDMTIDACELRNSSGNGFYKGGGLTVQGDLFLYDSTVSNNVLSTDLGHALGGGVYAFGDLVIVGSTISGNRASSAATNGIIDGGGTYSFHSTTLRNSTVTGNTAEGVGASSSAHGGGVYALGTFVAKYDTIDGNQATSPHDSGGGGATTLGHAYMEWTTISANAAGKAGGLELIGGNTTPRSTLFDSTISGNHATSGSAGGLLVDATATLQNCTVAFNTEQVAGGAGLLASTYALELQGTIIAGNTSASVPSDFGTMHGATIAAASSHNLIVASTVAVPADTLQVDPRLNPLRDNGGHTNTHALRGNSPAIDHGNNVHPGGADQRGSGFPRIIGTDADIGAFEYDPDRIFTNGFN